MLECGRYVAKIYETETDKLLAVIMFTYHDVQACQITNWASHHGYSVDDLYTDVELMRDNVCVGGRGHPANVVWG